MTEITMTEMKNELRLAEAQISTILNSLSEKGISDGSINITKTRTVDGGVTFIVNVTASV